MSEIGAVVKIVDSHPCGWGSTPAQSCCVLKELITALCQRYLEVIVQGPVSGIGEVVTARFPLNVSVIATNRSCLLARTLLRFAGSHKQPSFDLLQGLLYLEAC